MSYRLDNLFLEARYWIINIDILYTQLILDTFEINHLALFNKIVGAL